MISPGTEAALLDSWDYSIHLAVVLTPLFIGASFLVGLAQEYLPPERVEELLRSRDHGSGNVLAAGLGAVTPFCSCSTVPVLAGRGVGVARGSGVSRQVDLDAVPVPDRHGRASGPGEKAWSRGR